MTNEEQMGKLRSVLAQAPEHLRGGGDWCGPSVEELAKQLEEWAENVGPATHYDRLTEAATKLRELQEDKNLLSAMVSEMDELEDESRRVRSQLVTLQEENARLQKRELERSVTRVNDLKTMRELQAENERLRARVKELEHDIASIPPEFF